MKGDLYRSHFRPAFSTIPQAEPPPPQGPDPWVLQRPGWQSPRPLPRRHQPAARKPVLYYIVKVVVDILQSYYVGRLPLDGINCWNCEKY